MPFAPGVQMKGIPNKSLGATLGVGNSGLDDPEDDVEEAVRSTFPYTDLIAPRARR